MSSISEMAITLAVKLPIQQSTHAVSLNPATCGVCVCVKHTEGYDSIVCIAVGLRQQLKDKYILQSVHFILSNYKHRVAGR